MVSGAAMAPRRESGGVVHTPQAPCPAAGNRAAATLTVAVAEGDLVAGRGALPVIGPPAAGPPGRGAVTGPPVGGPPGRGAAGTLPAAGPPGARRGVPRGRRAAGRSSRLEFDRAIR
jgi:hypothetical protein